MCGPAQPATATSTSRGLQAVNQTSANLVKRSTNEPLSTEKEDTTSWTIEQVSSIVQENNRNDRKGVLVS